MEAEKTYKRLAKYKERSSQIGKIMGTGKGSPLTETARKYLVQQYNAIHHHRRREINAKYLEKGISAESESITAYLVVTKRPFHQENKINVFNEFITGTPDLIFGDIMNADLVTDTKTCWDLDTFHNIKYMAKGLDKSGDYFWQGQGYMALTGAKFFHLAYCLVNTPEPLVLDEIRKAQWKYNVTDPAASPAFQKIEAMIRRNHTFDDIPLKDRVHIIEIRRDEYAIDQIYKKVQEVRAWLCQTFFPDLYLTENLILSINQNQSKHEATISTGN